MLSDNFPFQFTIQVQRVAVCVLEGSVKGTIRFEQIVSVDMPRFAGHMGLLSGEDANDLISKT